MSQVNLLPPEIRQRQRLRRLTSLVGLAGVGLLAVVGLFYVLQVMNLGRVEDELRAQEARNADLQAAIQELQPFADLQTALQGKRELNDIVFANEVSWSGTLRDISRLIPSDAYLTDLTGSVTVATAAQGEAPEEETAGLIGSITFNGVARDIDSLAVWLTRLEQVKGWANPWAASAQLTEAESGISAYQFSGSVDLSADAVTRRGAGGGEQR
jgi:Tfp pilus assembly protein PilN